MNVFTLFCQRHFRKCVAMLPLLCAGFILGGCSLIYFGNRETDLSAMPEYADLLSKVYVFRKDVFIYRGFDDRERHKIRVGIPGVVEPALQNRGV